MIRSIYFLAFTILLSCQQTLDIVKVPLHIIPEPFEIIVGKDCLPIDKNNFKFVVSEKKFMPFIKKWQKQSGILDSSSTNATQIKFILEEIPLVANASTKLSAYRLIINETGITIKAYSQWGFFYGFQSVRQLLDGSNEDQVCLPFCRIKDYPRFPYRGMHLDVCRHFFDVEFIKKYIDLLAYHKINYFHWHLTEDQGWRIEIKKYPKLQEVAAYRDETLIGHYNDQPHQFDGKKYGGFYTHQEVKEIVTYAQERYVNIIPEIEMPGHAQAALAAYPELGCSGGPYKVLTKWGISENVYCPYEKTFEFLKDVIDEVVELFPGQFIHIGGDECPKTTWKDSEFCQKMIKDLDLKDEHGLQSYFISRMEKYINSKGKKIIGWDEILEGGLAPNAAVMSWRGTEGGLAAARQKHNVVMSPTSHCYFDYYQSEDDKEPLAIGGFLPLQTVYEYEPVPEDLESEFHEYILGAQGNVWTEYMKTSDHVEYMAYPRACAMAEIGWSAKKNKNFKKFNEKLDVHLERLKRKDVNVADHRSEIKAAIKNEGGKVFAHLETANEKATIKYWNNTRPDEIKEYINKIRIYAIDSLFYQAYVDDEPITKIYKKRFKDHYGQLAKYSLEHDPAEKYGRFGDAVLMNGVVANPEKFGDKEWLGFEGDDAVVNIDLGREISLEKVRVNFFNAPAFWIYPPKTIAFYHSEDGESWSKYSINKVGTNNRMKYNTQSFFLPGLRTRFLKVVIENYGQIPTGAEGAGHKSWLFLDELEIY